ncbi:LIM and senescent cell antigen-like-containing domain protein 1 [Corticium candelabrum]|uniref:LIM and senescent cell antigen-like-containing domain protein 1 n=1 Tax=Corticium candelabrum TaxID=121492 RepID=UPI002E25A96D|nr:LIM and senescent cell antigen-like-containing domain protein 1 [Corticium candelabrum]
MAAVIGPGTPCSVCQEIFIETDKIMNASGRVWHDRCFVCVQCFRPFKDSPFYEYDGRHYCEYDFQTLYAPCCGDCGKFIVGRVINAMQQSWHPSCFKCINCHCELASVGYVKNSGKPLCKRCSAELKGAGKSICYKCHFPIHDGGITFHEMKYHPHHFNCFECHETLTTKAREFGGDLYCLRCYDKLESTICGACRRPIEGRIIHALGKTWHPEHFVCAHCEKPFDGRRHYEKKGLAYCEAHFNMLYGERCFYCDRPVGGEVISEYYKSWCVHHFRCYGCDRNLTSKDKFVDFDLKPMCKRCYEHLPMEMRKRLKAQADGTVHKTAKVKRVKKETGFV